MAQWIKSLVVKPHDLSMIPVNHMMERGRLPSELIVWSHMPVVAYAHSPKINKNLTF